VRFITPVLHPNITKHGRICHPIFDREWTAHTHVYEVLQQVFGIFMSLESRDAIDPLFTLTFWTDPASGRREVERYVQRFASRTRQQLRQDIIGATSTAPSVSNMTETNLHLHTTTTNPNGQIPPLSTTSRSYTLVSHPRDRNSAQTPGAPLHAPAVPRRTSSVISAGTMESASTINASSNSGRRLSRRQSFFSMFRSSQNS